MNIYHYLSKKQWAPFIKKAFRVSDYFTIERFEYKEDHRKSVTYDYFFAQLEPHLIAKKEKIDINNLSIFDTEIYCYQCNFFTQEIVLDVGNIKNFDYPKYPENLCFYKKDKIWFKSNTHENCAHIQTDDQEILNTFKEYERFFS